MAFGCLNPFCYDEVSDVPEKIIFFEQYRGYNLLYSEAGAVVAWHDI